MILSLTIFLPLVGIPILAIGGREMPARTARWIALAVSLATFVVSLVILRDFETGVPGYQLVESVPWVKAWGLGYVVGVDGISLWMVLMSTFLMPIAILASWKIEKNVPLYMGAMLLLETAMVGSFLAIDLLLFFFFFEALLFPMYLIIGAWGGERRIYAAVKFFLYTMAGSALLFVAIVFIWSRSSSLPGGASFDIRQLSELGLAASTARWLFVAFFIAFAVKVPVFPLHTWLPDAHTEAPTAGSVILAAVLLKVGTYGLIRFNLGLFPEASRYFADAISILAVVGIIYGGVVALIQSDIKRLVAYSSVSHLGLIVLGIFALNLQSTSGAVLLMVSHGLATGGLFLLIGMMYERTHTRDLGELGGLARVMPWLGGIFLAIALASLGLPGLVNFVGEFLVVTGSLASSRVFGALAASGIILSAIYMLWSYRRAMVGQTPERFATMKDLSLREALVIVPILSLVVLFGVRPNLLLDRVTPSTAATVERVEGSVVSATDRPAAGVRPVPEGEVPRLGAAGEAGQIAADGGTEPSAGEAP